MSQSVELQVRAPDRRQILVRRVRFLVAATITYNVVEAVVALTAGSVASSSALLGFGLDSVIEVSSAAALAWQFSARDHDRRESRERIALRVTALSFFALAVFVSADSLRSLVTIERPDQSDVGIALAGVSLLLMPGLSYAQRRAGRQLGSRSAVADSKQTLLCTYMSAVLLFGLLANAVLGWWWADAVAGLGIAAIAVKEGIGAWNGDACCAPAPGLVASSNAESPAGCADGCDCRH